MFCALPHEESDFVPFTKRSLRESFSACSARPQRRQSPLAKKTGSRYNAFTEADFS